MRDLNSGVMLTFLEFLVETSEVENHIYVRHPGTGAIHTGDRNSLHTQLTKKHNLPSHGKEYDNLERGFYRIHHGMKRLSVRTVSKHSFVHADVISHIHKNHPETKKYDIRDDSTNLHEAKFDSAHIYLMHPTTHKVHTGGYGTFHQELAAKHGAPVRGKEFDNMERGTYRIQHSAKKVRVMSSSSHQFAHPDVIKHIQKKHPETKDYEVVD